MDMNSFDIQPDINRRLGTRPSTTSIEVLIVGASLHCEYYLTSAFKWV